ncbi:MAG: hypothetical protein ACYTE8_02190 [Planctomycetota bacterium]|jgi:hypothetical protein
MKPPKEMKNLLKESKVSISSEKNNKILSAAMLIYEKRQKKRSILFEQNIWRTIMKNRITKFAAAAVIIIAVLIGINQLDSSIDIASVTWGQEIIAAIETIKGVSCREQIFMVTEDGSKHLSTTWNILYLCKDSYRRDIYDVDTLREIQWYVPDGNTMLQHSIRFDLESYFVERHKGSFGVQNPIDRVRFYVQFLDNAGCILGTKQIEDSNCVGFEIKASEYGNNPEQWIDQIWFDVETKLPVVIEQHGRPVTDHPKMTFTTAQDEFNYNDELPEDTFNPYIPNGYIFGHPDDITSQ